MVETDGGEIENTQVDQLIVGIGETFVVKLPVTWEGDLLIRAELMVECKGYVIKSFVLSSTVLPVYFRYDIDIKISMQSSQGSICGYSNLSLFRNGRNQETLPSRHCKNGRFLTQRTPLHIVAEM